MTDERHERLVARTWVGRPHARRVFFLASAGAAYVTGQLLQVNGGAGLGRG